MGKFEGFKQSVEQKTQKEALDLFKQPDGIEKAERVKQLADKLIKDLNALYKEAGYAKYKGEITGEQLDDIGTDIARLAHVVELAKTGDATMQDIAILHMTPKGDGNNYPKKQFDTSPDNLSKLGVNIRNLKSVDGKHDIQAVTFPGLKVGGQDFMFATADPQNAPGRGTYITSINLDSPPTGNTMEGAKIRVESSLPEIVTLKFGPGGKVQIALTDGSGRSQRVEGTY